MAQLAAGIVFVGLTSDGPNADADREWLGRAAGWLTACAIVWADSGVSGLCRRLPRAVCGRSGSFCTGEDGRCRRDYFRSRDGIFGIEFENPGKIIKGDQNGATALALNVVLAVAGPIFAAILIVALSAALDHLLFADALAAKLQLPKMKPRHTPFCRGSMIGLVIAALIAAIASYCVNVNRFSLHALYRNRLIRGYLGASSRMRDPDRFTGFDFKDNVCVHELWPPNAARQGKFTQPVPCRQYRAQRRLDQAPGLAGAQGGIVYRHAAALRQRLFWDSAKARIRRPQTAAFRLAPRWRFPAPPSARIWAITLRRRSRYY